MKSHFITPLIAAMLLIGCSKENTERGTAIYLVKSNKSGINVTSFYPSSASQTTFVESTSLTTEFKAKSEDLLYVSVQSVNEDACVTAWIVFKGDTVTKSRVCGNYPTATAIYEIPFKD